jgi:hypothetical protein
VGGFSGSSRVSEVRDLWMDGWLRCPPPSSHFITAEAEGKSMLLTLYYFLPHHPPPPPLSRFHHLSRLTLELHRTSSSLLEGIVASMTTRAVIMSVRGEKVQDKVSVPILFSFLFFLLRMSIRRA